MTVAALLILGQAADGLAYRLIMGRPGEVNLFAGHLDPTLILAIKLAAGATAAATLYLLNRPRLGAWLAAASWFGALTECAAA